MAIKLLNNQYNSKKLNPEIVWRLINESIDETNQLYNAFTNRCKNSVESVQESRKRFDKNCSLGVLDGIPIVVKDNFCVEGQYTTCGSAMLKNFKPKYTSTIVTKLKKAGAIIVGKTNMDEFAMGSGTKNETFGRIINPYTDNEERLCATGGSSGGTAVAVAAGWALAGLGTDTGGSVRLPATLTGLVGLKPTYGSLSRHGVIALMNSLDTPSIVTRHVADAHILFDLLKGRDLRDPTSIDYPIYDQQQPPIDISSLRIGIPDEFRPSEMADDVIDVWEDAAAHLDKLGCRLSRLSMPHVPHAGRCYSVLCCAELASNMARYDGIRYGHRSSSSSSSFDGLLSSSRSTSLGAAVRERILMGNFFLLRGNRQYLEEASKIWRLITADFDRAFQSVDVLLTPVATRDAPPVSVFTVLDNDHDDCVDNRVAMVRGDLCTQPASLAGVPAMAVPVRLSARAMPIGVQVTAPRCREDLVFLAGAAIEDWAAFGHRFGPAFSLQPS